MTRQERKEAARIRCEERVNGYRLSVEKYISQMKPTMNKAILHIQDRAHNEIRKVPQMKEEIERCQGQATAWLLEHYSDKLVLDEKLTPEQVINWRKLLCGMGLGAWALIMPEEDIDAIRKKFQQIANQLS